jgi:hypothetical protein
VPLALASVVAAVMEITFSHDAEGADRGKHPAFSAVHLVHVVAVTHRPAFTSAWQVKVFREDVLWLTLIIPIAIDRAAAATEVAVPVAATIAIVVARIVPVQHGVSRCWSVDTFLSDGPFASLRV